MKLNSVEIQGFKSFPDKIKLEFNCPITAVVGPNGSGKSNIGDAIRWVLGEQSVKTLRGDKMEDVIFGGTGERNSMGFANVVIIIDNSDRSIESMEDEISISRRIYRDGESDYKINGKSTRLKDIQEIFMDTGLGKGGYFIIGQGKISEIISAKGRERREIFEEAAGISKYRYHKLEAEKKLLKAEENLERLNDIFSEIEGRIEPLKKESKRAEKFFKLSEKKKKIEVSLWLNSLDKLSKNIKKENEKILASQKEYNDINTQAEKIEEKIQSIFKRMQECSSKSESHRVKIKELQEEKSSLISQKAVYENDIKHNLKTEKEYDIEITSLEKTIADLEEKNSEKSQKLEENKTKTGKIQSEIQKTDRELENIKNAKERNASEISFKKSHRAALYLETNREKLKLASDDSVLDQNKTRLNQLKERLKLSENEENILQRKINKIDANLPIFEEKINEFKNQKGDNEIKIKDLSEQISILNLDILNSENQIKLNTQKAIMLSDIERNAEERSDGVKSVLDASKKGILNGIYGTVASAFSTDEKYGLALESALGNKMQYVIAEDEITAQKAIDYLIKKKAGRCTFVPISSVCDDKIYTKNINIKEKGFISKAVNLVKCEKKYCGILNVLLGKTLIFDSFDNAFKAALKYGYSFNAVTLDGQFICEDGSFTGGVNIGIGGILTGKNTIEKLKKENADLKEKIKKILEKREKITRKNDIIKENIEDCNKNIKIALEDREIALNEKKKTEYEADAEIKKREIFLAEKENLEKTVSEYKFRNKITEEALIKLKDEIQSIEKEILEKSEEKQNLLHSESICEQELSSLKVTLAILEKDTEVLFQSNESYLLQIISEKQRKEEVKNKKQKIINNNDELKEKIKFTAERIKEIDELSLDYSESIKTLNTMQSELQKEISKLRSNSKDIIYKREKFAAELSGFSERSERYRSDYDSIIEKIWNEYEISLTQAEKIRISIIDEKESESEIVRIKDDIKILGNVNLKAAEEYKEVNQRYQFMKKQIDDVVKSKNALNKLIVDLTLKMKKIFAEKFDLINKNFSVIFSELFDGGWGRLYLTDKSDVLESGIEIEARPPGKIIKNLNLLSGGEQAFTAIAIYFAMLKVNPSPFCILDEIEAALDEVNVVKFAKYLRKLSDKTQFIAITHRRGTMEEADVLYGVTMQEEGVSKLLKLDPKELPENYNNN